MIGKIFDSSVYGISSAAGSRSAENIIPAAGNFPPSPSKETLLNQSVKVTLSEEALEKLGLSVKSEPQTNNATAKMDEELSEQEKKEVEKLKTRDQEVRDHERAHMMAGGTLVRKGASYQYETGPDGKRYAVGGEVSIDASPVEDNPEATIRKMQQVKRAALAPAEPSSQDRAVAASASQKEAQARVELRQEATEE